MDRGVGEKYGGVGLPTLLQFQLVFRYEHSLLLFSIYFIVYFEDTLSSLAEANPQTPGHCIYG